MFACSHHFLNTRLCLDFLEKNKISASYNFRRMFVKVYLNVDIDDEINNRLHISINETVDIIFVKRLFE